MEKYIVETTNGKVQGHERDGMVEYMGIPYAQPPVGELRLKRARPAALWEGVFDAGKYGAPSVQLENDQQIGDEDCLTLNIRRPLGGEKLPVLVYIHGGGYNTGMASDPLYEGASFVSHGIVYISIQYRLNVWGFYDFTSYPGGKEFDSNCGISDHILAMKWIHENVKAFGGNPEQVTIAGESAGGTSVITMMSIPALKGTFQQAIASSSLPNALFSHEMSRENIDLFLEGMGWTQEDLPKLRTVDAFEVQKGNTYVAEKHQYKNPGIFLPSPVIDDLIPERPLDAIRKGCAKDIKLMIGTNMHEGTMFVRFENTNFPSSWAMIEEMFEKHGYQEGFQAIKEYYQGRNLDTINGIEEAFIHFATDYAFQVPALKVAEAQKAFNDVWIYRYEYISEFAKKTGMLAAHAMDLPCAFNEPEFGFAKELFQDDPKEVVEKLINEIHMSWVRFIKTGAPNGSEWPRYTGYNSLVRIFDKETRTEQLYRNELMKVWGDMRFYEK